MDPTATLRRFLEALQEGDDNEMRASAYDLAEWRAKGGFLPDIHEAARPWLGMPEKKEHERPGYTGPQPATDLSEHRGRGPKSEIERHLRALQKSLNEQGRNLTPVPRQWMTFEQARDWAGENVKGHPAWRVVIFSGEPRRWAVELSPGGPLCMVGQFGRCEGCDGSGVIPAIENPGLGDAPCPLCSELSPGGPLCMVDDATCATCGVVMTDPDAEVAVATMNCGGDCWGCVGAAEREIRDPNRS